MTAGRESREHGDALPHGAGDAQRLDDLYRAKVRAEIAAAEAVASGPPRMRGAGDELATVLLLKGEPGAEDLHAGRPLAGADGVAIGKALEALGFDEARYALCTRLAGSEAARPADSEWLRVTIEALDPRIVIALDSAAAEDFVRAYAVDALTPGEPRRVLTRVVLALDDFAASLGDESSKRRAWRQLKALGGAPRQA